MGKSRPGRYVGGMTDEPDSLPDDEDELPRSPELMRPADTALLVIDMQERLLAALPTAEAIIWNCRRLLDGARILDLTAAATEQNPEKLGGTVAALAPRLDRAALPKMAFSCGQCGALFSAWRQAGVERVLVCGIEAHVCVQQTVLDLLAAGYRVYVAADATGSRHLHDAKIALRRMDSAGAVLTTTEAALFELCGRAGTNAFRQISALAKEARPGDAN
jgi:nicotinamidase-related amidase